MVRGAIPSRGQTEPLAALVAVMAMAFAITLYAGYIGGVLPGVSDRAPEESMVDDVWEDIEDEERGVFPAYKYEDDNALKDALAAETLPDGHNVYIKVWGWDDGERTVFAEAHFDSAGDDVDERHISSTDPDHGPPEGPGEPDDTGVATRSVSVELTPGDVRGGTLHVEVWS